MEKTYLPYGRQLIEEEDIRAVEEVLRSDWLTTGPLIDRFEDAVCRFVDARFGVAVSSGTAALHAAMHALQIGRGDEVIVPPMTFTATANSVLLQGARPVFVDIDMETLLLDPARVENAITSRTRAILAVDYAGQPCDWIALRAIADKHGLALVADACHALGARRTGRKVGSLADITCFSFHPVKHITTGEGGMAVTGDEALARSMRAFRNHGIESSAFQREKCGQWYYEMKDLGYNYRLADFQCALGLSQLRRLDKGLARRRQLAHFYNAFFASSQGALLGRPLAIAPGVEHAWHLYVIRHPQRNKVFQSMRAQGIGVNVHYIPVHLHPYYREHLGTGPGLCPVAEAAYEEILTLPLWPGMDEAQQIRVIRALEHVETVGHGVSFHGGKA